MPDQSPTLKEIARQLNVSVSTVSRALHNHYSIGLRTRMRVQQLASQLNYEPNQAAISFKQKKTSMIGVILPHLSQDFFASMVNGIEDVAYRNNYTVMLCQSRDDQSREKQLVHALKTQRVDGLLISMAKDTTDYDHFGLLQKHKIPVVFLDRVPKMQDIHYVASSLDSGMQEAVDFLIQKKHRRIALINGPSKLPASQERLDTFRQALWHKRRKYDPALVVYSDLSKEGTVKAMQELMALKQTPDAIVAFNDYVALDAIQYAKHFPNNISIVSFANEPRCLYMDNAPIASVEQFPYQQGEKATRLLLQLLEKPTGQSDDKPLHHELLRSQLVIHRPV